MTGFTSSRGGRTFCKGWGFHYGPRTVTAEEDRFTSLRLRVFRSSVHPVRRHSGREFGWSLDGSLVVRKVSTPPFLSGVPSLGSSPVLPPTHGPFSRPSVPDPRDVRRRPGIGVAGDGVLAHIRHPTGPRRPPQKDSGGPESSREDGGRRGVRTPRRLGLWGGCPGGSGVRRGTPESAGFGTSTPTPLSLHPTPHPTHISSPVLLVVFTSTLLRPTPSHPFRPSPSPVPIPSPPSPPLPPPSPPLPRPSPPLPRPSPARSVSSVAPHSDGPVSPLKGPWGLGEPSTTVRSCHRPSVDFRAGRAPTKGSGPTGPAPDRTQEHGKGRAPNGETDQGRRHETRGGGIANRTEDLGPRTCDESRLRGGDSPTGESA